MNYGAAWRTCADGTRVVGRPTGASMRGLIASGSLVEIDPAIPEAIEPGDIILVKVHGRVFLHLAGAVRDGNVQVRNNTGGINGWAPLRNIAGICVSVNGQPRPKLAGKVKTSQAEQT